MANYHKACDHPNIERRPHSRTWICLECGHDVPELRDTHGNSANGAFEASCLGIPQTDPMARDAAAMGIGAPGSFTEALGPIKIDYTRDQAMRDARALNWRLLPWGGTAHRMHPPPLDRPFYVAWRTLGDRWSVVRVAARDTVPREATHWCDDLLGLPACSD